MQWSSASPPAFTRMLVLVKHFEHIWVVQSLARHTDAFEESKIKTIQFSVEGVLFSSCPVYVTMLKMGGSEPAVPS